MVKNCLIGMMFLVAGAAVVYLLGRMFHLPGLIVFVSKAALLFAAGGAIFILVLRKIWGEERAGNLIKNILVLGVTLLIMIVAGEYTARYMLSDITTTGDNNSYFALKWKRANVRLNSRGFREREIDPIKAKGLYRLAIIGDSYTYGQGIYEEERFGELLEQYLNGHKPHYEVLNFGHPGYDTVEALSTLQEDVLDADPDFVLIQWGINDFEGYQPENRPRTIPLLISERLHKRLHKILHGSSVLYYLMERQWDSLQKRFGYPEISYSEYMLEQFGPIDSPGSRRQLEALGEAIRLCKERKIGFGMVLFPSSGHNLDESYPYHTFHNRIHDQCKEGGAFCLDLRSAFAPYSGKGRQLMVNKFDGHPNVFANRIAADELIRAYSPIWLDQ
jgi:hypothetical protein